MTAFFPSRKASFPWEKKTILLVDVAIFVVRNPRLDGLEVGLSGEHYLLEFSFDLVGVIDVYNE